MESTLAAAERERRASQAGRPGGQSKSERTALIRQTAVAFCKALSSKEQPPDYARILSDLFTTKSPRITEHGPLWARERLPFIAQTFEGIGEGQDGTCNDYFVQLGKVLKLEMRADTFPPENEFVVDVEAVVDGGKGKGAVCVVSRLTRFESLDTGKAWSESFAYRLSGFDDEGKIGHWEIWADPLSAWAAVED